jgi:hypothetical protein
MNMNANLYDINVHIVVNKRNWHNSNMQFDEDVIKNKIQSGLKIPLENCEVIIMK